MNTFFVDKLKVNVYSNRQEMGKSAAENIAEKFKELIKQKGEINVVWAAEISKSGFYELDYLGWCVLLFALFLVLSYGVFLKKDIQFRS